MPRTTAIVLGVLRRVPLVYLLGFFNIETKQSLDQFTKGMVKFVLHFLFLAASVSVPRAARPAVLLALARLVQRRARRELRLRRAAAPLGEGRPQPRQDRALAAHRRRELDQRLRLGRRLERLPAERADRATRTISGSCSIVPLLVLLPVYLRLERGHRLEEVARGRARLHALVLLSTLSRSGLLGLGVGLLVLALPYRRFLWSRALLAPLAGVAPPARVRALFALALLLRRAALARADGRRVELGALRGLRLHPADHPLAPAARPRAEQRSPSTTSSSPARRTGGRTRSGSRSSSRRGSSACCSSACSSATSICGCARRGCSAGS